MPRSSILPLAVLFGSLALAQTNVLTATAEKLTIKRTETATAKVHAQLKSGYHTNSNTPSDEFLIPLRLTWEGPLEVVEVVYPKPRTETYPFSSRPVSVFTGDFEIQTKFKVSAGARNGLAMLSGKLRYQACTDKICLPPKTITIPLTVEIQ